MAAKIIPDDKSGTHMEHVGAALVISANYPKKRAGTAAGRGKGEILPSLLHMMVSCSSLDKNVFVVLGRALWTRQSKLGGIITQPRRARKQRSGLPRNPAMRPKPNIHAGSRRERRISASRHHND
ncbi:MAG: hypothetical protein WBG17_13125 [Burkholderiaceae bacterium]